MQFICKSECLNFSDGLNLPKDSLYYKYQAKQIRNKLIDEKNRLDVMLQQIINEQSTQNKPIKTRHHFTSDGFYQYANQWKKRLQRQISQQSNIQAINLAKKQEESMMVIKKNHNRFDTFKRNHKGPISAWKQHFQKYIRHKAAKNDEKQDQSIFKPKINNKSNQILSTSTQPVQKRLIQYGKQIQIKRQEYANQYYNQFRKYPSNSVTSDSNIYSKLYKQAEKINRERVKKYQQQYSFKPQITKISEKMEERIKLIRKPLYCLKWNGNVTFEQIKQPEKKTHRNSEGFKQFLKRNEVLLEMKKKIQLQKENADIQYQKYQQNMCTFSPEINSNSKKIYKTKQQYDNQYLNSRFQDPVLTETRIQTTQRQNVAEISLDAKSDSISDSFDQLNSTKIKDIRPLSTSPRTQSNPSLPTYFKKQKRLNEQYVSNKGDIIDQLNEEDSIEKMKQSEWQSQLKDVEDQLQKMMSRAIKN